MRRGNAWATGVALAQRLRYVRFEASSSTGGPNGSSAAQAPATPVETHVPKQPPTTAAAASDPQAETGSSSSLASQAPPPPSSMEAGAEPITVMRWEQRDPDLRIVDEKGEYIVSTRGKWHTGEIAYQTPPPPNHLQARFGYNVVQVKKPQTYWQYYRWNPHFSLRHLNFLVLFAVGLTFLCSFLMKEVKTMQDDIMKPGQLTGSVRGKGRPAGKDMKISTSLDEQNDMMAKVQQSYLNAEELAFKGNKDYQMKKIIRPKEFRAQDFMRA
jgi:hypothetical protein